MFHDPLIRYVQSSEISVRLTLSGKSVQIAALLPDALLETDESGLSPTTGTAVFGPRPEVR